MTTEPPESPAAAAARTFDQLCRLREIELWASEADQCAKEAEQRGDEANAAMWRGVADDLRKGE